MPYNLKTPQLHNPKTSYPQRPHNLSQPQNPITSKPHNLKTLKPHNPMNRYIVFLKQVPRSTKVDIDPVTKTLKRASAMTRTNPDDLCALQAALDMRAATGGEIVAVSMGPDRAEDTLCEALQLGADRAVLLSSPAFAGSDTLCTSMALAAAARKIGYGMLLFGRMAVDGDTAQVGPEVAGQLGIPQLTHIISIDNVGGENVTVTKDNGETVQQLRVSLPCALMVSKEFAVCPPTLAGWRRAMKQPIERWNESDIGLSAAEVGLNASPTKVVSTAVVNNAKDTRWVSSGEEFARAVMNCAEK